VTAVAPPRARSDGAALRLTRRGRLALTTLTALAAAAAIVAMVVALGALGAEHATAESGRAPVQERRAVLVQPGETLWSIAAQVDAEADRRDVIDEIVRINGLPSSQVAAGQTLVLPAG
jgi:nucleoid-associated protein YgaU